MVEPEELWIGDKLRIIDSGRIGSFEGIDNELVKIKSGREILIINPKNLEIIKEDEKNVPELLFTDEGISEKKIEMEIDLHIEILKPSLLNALPERIVDFQIKAFETYLGNAVKQKLNPIIIIHGKGAGVLKSLVHNSLTSHKNISHFHLINNDGATEAYLKF